MGDPFSISFSSFIAGLLLFKDEVTAIDIVNMMSRLDGIYVDDENDDLEILKCCVDFETNYCFCLKRGYSYQTMLSDGSTVFQFLTKVAGESFLSVLMKNSGFKNVYESLCSGGQPIKENQSDINGQVFLDIKKNKVKKRVHHRFAFTSLF